MDETRQWAKSVPFLDNGFGRRMRVGNGREHTQAPALMGQGCARDLMAEAVLRLPIEVVPLIRMWAHDEIVLSIPEAEVDAVSDAVLDAMSFEWRGVQILGDASKIGPSWGSVCSGPNRGGGDERRA